MISDTRADRGEARVVLGVIAAERADVVERARLQPEQVLAVHQLGIGRVLVDLGDHRLVEAGRHHVDHLHAETNSPCSLVATLPETKMPRWPMV